MVLCRVDAYNYHSVFTYIRERVLALDGRKGSVA